MDVQLWPRVSWTPAFAQVDSLESPHLNQRLPTCQHSVRVHQTPLQFCAGAVGKSKEGVSAPCSVTAIHPQDASFPCEAMWHELDVSIKKTSNYDDRLMRHAQTPQTAPELRARLPAPTDVRLGCNATLVVDIGNVQLRVILGTNTSCACNHTWDMLFTKVHSLEFYFRFRFPSEP